MIDGDVSGGGRFSSRVRSTCFRRAAKYESSDSTPLIRRFAPPSPGGRRAGNSVVPLPPGEGAAKRRGRGVVSQPLFRSCVLFFFLEGLDDRLALRIGEDQLDLFLHLFELLIAET